MPTAVIWLVWSLMLTAVVGGSHYYLWRRLVRGTGLGQPWRRIATALLVAGGLLVPASFVLGRFGLSAARNAIVFASFSWLGFCSLLLTLLLGTELLRAAATLAVRASGSFQGLREPARRLFLARLLAGGAMGVALGLSGAGIGLGLRAPVLRRLRVALRRLPRELSGLRVVQLTDVHLGEPIGGDYLAEVVRRVNALQPDLVAITGDLVDGGTSLLAEVVAPLGELRARYGVFFVTGNHEYYSGVEPWLELLRGLGIRVLRNEHARVGPGAATLVVAGVDDVQGRRLAPGHGPDLERALAGVRPDEEVLLLAHRPRQIGEASERGVGLQLSGHTHGGQMWPMTMLIGLAEPYTLGLHRHGATQIYVSAGTGLWGPPMRLGTASEISEIELVRG